MGKQDLVIGETSAAQLLLLLLLIIIDILSHFYCPSSQAAVSSRRTDLYGLEIVVILRGPLAPPGD